MLPLPLRASTLEQKGHATFSGQYDERVETVNGRLSTDPIWHIGGTPGWEAVSHSVRWQRIRLATDGMEGGTGPNQRAE